MGRIVLKVIFRNKLPQTQLSEMCKTRSKHAHPNDISQAILFFRPSFILCIELQKLFQDIITASFVNYTDSASTLQSFHVSISYILNCLEIICKLLRALYSVSDNYVYGTI